MLFFISAIFLCKVKIHKDCFTFLQSPRLSIRGKWEQWKEMSEISSKLRALYQITVHHVFSLQELFVFHFHMCKL